MKHFPVILFPLLAILIIGFQSNSSAAAPITITLFSTAPSMQLPLNAKEWGNAAQFDGFAWNGKLERRKASAWIGATKDAIYIAVSSQLPIKGNLTTEVMRGTVRLVFDDSVEIWIDPTPGTEAGETYQMLANSAGKQAWVMHPRGGAQENPVWRGDWNMVSGMENGWWQCIFRIPVAGIAPGRTTDQGMWGINVCRNWKNPWMFSSLGGGPYPPSMTFRFTDQPTLAIRQSLLSDPFTGNVDALLGFFNPSSKPITVTGSLLLTRDRMPDANERQILTIAPDATQSVELKVTDNISHNFQLSMLASGEDGAPVFQRDLAWQAAPPWQWITVQQTPPPIDMQFAYYPYKNLLRVHVDATGIPANATLKEIRLSVRKAGDVNPLKTVLLKDIVNKKVSARFTLPELDGEYQLAAVPIGTGLPKGDIIKTFVRKHFPWEHNKLGVTDKVYPPFTPLVVKRDEVFSVLRKHRMNGEGLWSQVWTKGVPLLASPMSYEAVEDGKSVPVKAGPLRFTHVAGNKVIASSNLFLGSLKAKSVETWDYDGTMRVDLTLLGSKRDTVNDLTFDIPLSDREAYLMHAMGDGIRNTVSGAIPKGEGVVWTSSEVQDVEMPPNFCTYIFLGNPNRGLCWFTENNKGWSWDPQKPNLDLYRENGVIHLRVHLIDEPTVIASPRTITFGLLAAPVKPRIKPWRFEWVRGKYTLLGTDINWLALGDCGSVYPAGKDMRLWQMIKLGNREHLTDEQIQNTFNIGKKYFEPYGQDLVNEFHAQVNYNLRSRYGMKMVFYYNRSSYQAADEFQTFQDEWNLTDYRSVGPGDSRNEIPIVPSESYDDMAEYWYGKSFDIGGNQGVYWDNWFFNPSSNTEMTSAFKDKSGTIVPSTGVWELRELAKRTFQYMNQRGMKPITMAHMTSTSILPMLSFTTLQYDWEWKYSEGDFQDRFTRDYILLVTDGELAGTWPVVLGDHGPLENDIHTQRTMAGVCLVHEIDPSGWMDKVWSPLFAPIFEILNQTKHKVWTYWADGKRLVQSGVNTPWIVYSSPGKEAVLVVTSYMKEDAVAKVDINLEMLGLGDHATITNVETGASSDLQAVKDGVADFSFALPKHDVREFRIIPAGATQPSGHGGK